MERNSYNTNLIENEMSKRVYFSPRIDLIPIEQPTPFLSGSVVRGNRFSGIDDPPQDGGKTDGTHEVNAKYSLCWDDWE